MRRHLARVDEELAEAGSVAARDDSIAAALSAFYRAVAAELRVAVQREAVASLEDALRVMRRAVKKREPRPGTPPRVWRSSPADEAEAPA